MCVGVTTGTFQKTAGQVVKQNPFVESCTSKHRTLRESVKLDRSSPGLLRPWPWLPPPWHVASGSTWNGFGVSCSTLHELKEPLQLSTLQIYHHLKCIEKPQVVPIAARFQPPTVAQEHTCHMSKSCTIHADLANHHLVELYNNLLSRFPLHNLRTVRSGEAGVYNFPHYKWLPSIHPKTSIHFKYPNHHMVQ